MEDPLNKRLAWAQSCRIPVFRELRLKMKRHLIITAASAKHDLSSVRMEAAHGKIKPGMRTALGFRNPDSPIAMVMLTCSDVRPSLPGR